MGIATVPVADPLECLGRSTHCEASYISFLLCDMAGCYSLPVRAQALVRRWATFWAPLVSLHKAEPGDPLPQFVVDLMQDGAAPSVRLPANRSSEKDGYDLSGDANHIFFSFCFK